VKPTLRGGSGSPASSASIMADAYACNHHIMYGVASKDRHREEVRSKHGRGEVGVRGGRG